jgi:5-methylcytosine-specific restriction protein B
MALPSVPKDVIEKAMAEFDQTLRASSDWANWEDNRAQNWVLDHNGTRYPPKKVISLATGIPVSAFSGGPESNEYLAARGFEVTRMRDTSLDDIFQLILERYRQFKATEPFGGHHEIKELFAQASRRIGGAPAVVGRKNLKVVGSFGKGNWATIPWVALLDLRETQTTQVGTYVVYLFREDGKGCYLILGQGVTVPSRELGARAPEKLAETARDIRRYCGELQPLGFNLSGAIDLGTEQRLAKLYEASTAASKYYPADAMPSEAQMLRDLDALLDAYQQYVDQRPETEKPLEDQRQLALIGTWHEVLATVPRIKESIARQGGWASWWSFPIREEGLDRLKTPFDLYAYVGNQKIAARIRVDAFQTSRGNGGIESPWPQQTDAQWVGQTRAGVRQSEVFKTWLRVIDLEVLTPPKSVDDFELAIGLSSPGNVINQNSFGYVIAEEFSSLTDMTTEAKQIPAALPINWLVDRTGLPATVLQEMVEAITGPAPQIMLAGPPGTSKSWVAKQLALYLTRNRPEQMQFVQFHPSYSYESFVEGLRPTTRDGVIVFERQNGVVLELVEKINRGPQPRLPGDEYVLVIDEANRANLPRVLGELMFLFEYRDDAVRLQYSEKFALPANLRFIATMNTADRSIRSLDVALRRRFDVFELLPDAALLAKYYEGAGRVCEVSELVAGFEALNQELGSALDRHHTIGHAFFMRDQLTAEGLAHIWKRKIFPLIEEYFFDQPELANEYTFDRFWPGVRRAN